MPRILPSEFSFVKYGHLKTISTWCQPEQPFIKKHVASRIVAITIPLFAVIDSAYHGAALTLKCTVFVITFGKLPKTHSSFDACSIREHAEQIIFSLMITIATPIFVFAPHKIKNANNPLIARARINPCLNKDHHVSLNDWLNKDVFPLYRRPYPDGSIPYRYGLLHTARTVLFSTLLSTFYGEAGYELTTVPVYVHIAMGLHDAGREGDGVDKWKKESSIITEEILKKKDHLADWQAKVLGNAVFCKNDSHPRGLEQKLLHDGIWLDGQRLPEKFKINLGSCYKDLDKALITQLVKEAKFLISITENDAIYNYIYDSPSPYACLIQLLKFMNHTPLMLSKSKNALEAFCGNGCPDFLNCDLKTYVTSLMATTS